MALPELLVLCDHIPYPPNQGGRDRSSHLLRFLGQHFDIHLAAFVDDPDDWQYVNSVHAMCKNSVLFFINPRRRRFSSLPALFGNRSFNVYNYRHSVMQKWVRQCIQLQSIQACLVLSSVMGQFVLDYTKKVKTVVDFVHVESAKNYQDAQLKTWLTKYIYRREAKRLFQYERQLAEQSSQSVFRSAQQAELFQKHSPELSNKITHVVNGVDIDYFDPSMSLSNPYKNNAPVLVFTGSMDDWANIDAVTWFAMEIWPQIQRKLPLAQYYIVGPRPTSSVNALAQDPSIIVTGQVEDIRPYLKFAHLAVAPLRSAAGFQNKILEAFAMEKPVVASAAAMQGIDNPPNESFDIAQSNEDWINLCVNKLSHSEKLDFSNSRHFVINQHNWDSNLERYLHLLAG